VPDEVWTFLDAIRDLECAPLVRLVVEQVCALGQVETEVGAFGVRFRCGESPLCELSVFGELFIARVGPDQAVEFRVRHSRTALAALDRILREHWELLPL
jgi:hypothetical protein